MSPHVVERLSAFLDGEMPEAERLEVQGHLERCPACARHLADLAVVDETARGLRVEAPAGYFESLPGRIRQRLRAPRRSRIPAWGWAAAAAALLAVLTPLVQHEHRAPTPQPAAAGESPRSMLPTRPAVPEQELPRPAPPTTMEYQEKARPAEAKPALAPLESRARKDLEARDAAKDEAPGPGGAEGFAPPPAPAAAPATPAPSALADEASAGRAERDQPAAPASAAPGQAAAGSLAKARGKLESEEGQASEAKRSVSSRLGVRAPRSADEARALREDWRRRAGLHAEGDAGDEARLGLVEAGAQAYGLSGDPADLEILRRDAGAYLARREARHADRVRELLRAAEER